MGLCLKATSGISLVIGLTMIVTGVVVLVLVIPVTLDEKIKESLQIRNGTEAGDRFVKSPVPSYMGFYFFNIDNVDAVNQNQEKPFLSQKGPYVYRQEKEKFIKNFDEKMGTVTYTEKTEYYFERDRSVGGLDDVIWHVDPVTMGILEKAPFLETTKLTSDLIVNHTVDELLFGGYETNVYFPEALQSLCLILKLCPRFGFQFEKNGSESMEYVVSTGVKTTDDIGEIKLYNFSRSLTYWKAPSCNALNGTDGKQFHPGVKEDEELYVFSSDLCRSLKLVFDKEVTIESIPALRFTTPTTLFADPNIFRDNMCFCPFDPCPAKAGVMPLWNCQEGKPVMASSPHFYLGEREYYENFGGLNPNKEAHGTFLDIEPMTGTVISAAKRIQISLLLRHYAGLKQTIGMKKDEFKYFPILWIEEGGQIDPKNAAEFRKKVLRPYRTGKWSMVALIAVGAVILLIIVIFAFMKSGSGGRGKTV